MAVVVAVQNLHSQHHAVHQRLDHGLVEPLLPHAEVVEEVLAAALGD